MKNITRGITCYSYNFGVVSGTQIKNICTMESYNKLGERELKRRCKDLGEKRHHVLLHRNSPLPYVHGLLPRKR